MANTTKSIAALSINTNPDGPKNVVTLGGNTKVKIGALDSRYSVHSSGDNMAAVAYGNADIVANDHSEITVGNTYTVKDDIDADLLEETSKVLTLPKSRLENFVRDLQEKLGVFKPTDLKYIDEDDIKELLTGVQQRKFLDYLGKIKQQPQDPTSTQVPSSGPMVAPCTDDT